MRTIVADEIAYLTYSGIRSWTPSLRNELAKGGRQFTTKIAADAIVRAFCKCVFQVEEGGANLSGADVTEIVAKLIETLPATRKRAIASSFAQESDAARRATALDIARSLDHLWITRDTPALSFPYPLLTGKPALPAYNEARSAE